MNRLHLPPPECQGSPILLRDAEAHHALHVLRLRPGDAVTVLDGQGGRLLCEVRERAQRTMLLDVRQKETVPPLSTRFTLYQAVPKGPAFDTIVQKATELGAWRIIPILSERVVVRFDGPQASLKVTHWRRIAIEAIKQCGSAWLPRIETPRTLPQALQGGESDDLVLVASLQAPHCHPRQVLDQFRSRHQRPPRSLSIWVGPEGDFTGSEIGAITGAGAVPITLGRLVLRVDTAALYCLSVLSYELEACADSPSAAP